MSQGSGQGPSTRTERFLWAILPIGIVLLIAWILWLVVSIAVGDTQRGFSVASGILGLVTSLVLIISGRNYRRALRSR
jgi:hypothetical protein